MNENIRLPKIAIPHRYEINLDINLDEFSYTGKEVVFLEIVDETKELQVHSLGIIYLKKREFHLFLKIKLLKEIGNFILISKPQ